MEEFEIWLRTVCFQKPTPEAYDLAKDAWKEALNTRPTPEAIEGIIWVGKCPNCNGAGKLNLDSGSYDPCLRCDGIGSLTRPATIEEVLEAMVGVLTHLNSPVMGAATLREIIEEQALTIHNGTLRIKEEV